MSSEVWSENKVSNGQLKRVKRKQQDLMLRQRNAYTLVKQEMKFGFKLWDHAKKKIVPSSGILQQQQKCDWCLF